MKNLKSGYNAVFLIMILFVIMTISLIGCGSENDLSSGTGSLTLKVTDAPIDGADKVVVSFTEVELKPRGGNSITIDIDDTQIDLLALNGGGSEIILNNYSGLPAGHYNWVRLGISAAEGENDSYLLFNNVTTSLRIPSGEETGLKLVSGFIIQAGGTADFTIDFDLRQSVHDPVGSGDYILRPTLRIVDNVEAGHIKGTVDESLINDPSCTSGNVVYVFQGSNVAADDVDGSDPDPHTSAMVKEVTFDNTSTGYSYKAAFLSPDDYTVAFTCQADEDYPTTDDLIDFGGTEANVTVTNKETITHNFNSGL